MGGAAPLPDWHDGTAYSGLLEAPPERLAWEWLRRDPDYVVASASASCHGRGGGRGHAVRITPAYPAAARWGLHAFEDPVLPVAAARPVWRRELFARVLVVRARRGGHGRDRFDLGRFSSLATVVADGSPREHVLLCDGRASLRIDVVAGSLLAGPVHLHYCLAGFTALPGPLDTLHRLLRLHRSGRLPAPAVPARNRRTVLLLRAWDALQAGASQRDIAEALLSADAAQARWRSEAPSLRLQAQRLAGGARAMAGGGYRALLAA